ncbi:hypothetical protein BC629DRAFT_1437950 [Irpex lacteus]|nr:hypothetical protein BC629DRAFT_1437950 [Irpex lacteus]
MQICGKFLLRDDDDPHATRPSFEMVFWSTAAIGPTIQTLPSRNIQHASSSQDMASEIGGDENTQKLSVFSALLVKHLRAASRLMGGRVIIKPTTPVMRKGYSELMNNCSISLVFMFPLNSVALEVVDRRVKTSLGKISNYPLASSRTARYEEGCRLQTHEQRMYLRNSICSNFRRSHLYKTLNSPALQ